MRCLDPKTTVDLAEGRLPRELTAAAQQHVTTCASCTARLAGLVFRAHPTPAAPELSPGTRLGDFEVREPVDAPAGRYRVSDQAGGLATAQLIPCPSEELRERLLGRLAEAAKVEHANLLAQRAQGVYQHELPATVEVEGTAQSAVHSAVYVIEEDLAAAPLREWLQSAPRSWTAIVRVFAAAGRGLAAAHERGVLHRGFERDCVLVGEDRVCLRGLGMAGDAEEHAEGPTARDYDAPECRAGAPASAASDQFSFAAALYHALFRTHPFAEGTHLPLPPPSDSRVPRAALEILLLALAEDPELRYPSMDSMLDELERVAARRGRGARVAALVAAVAAVAFAVALIIALTSSNEGAARTSASAAESSGLADVAAQPPAAEPELTPLERARLHFDRGQEQFESGAYPEAASSFAQAYTARPLPELAWNVAHAYQLGSDCANALAWYRRALRDAAQDPAQAAAAQAAIDELSSKCGDASATNPPAPTLPSPANGGG